MKSIKLNLLICFILIVILATCSGCGASFHLRKARYHEAKAIALGASIEEKSDTVIKYVDVPFPVTKLDTVFKVTNDTIRFTKDSIQYKILVRNNKVYLHTTPKVKYFRVKQTFYVNKTKTIKAGWTNWQYYSGIVGGILFGFVLGALLSRMLWR